MKIRIAYCLLAITLGLGCIHTNGWAQNNPKEGGVAVQRRSAISRKQSQQKGENESQSTLTTRALQLNKALEKSSENAPWKRIIYREISLDSVANAGLYYPPRPIGGERNLFFALFSLLNNGSITAYEYLDGYEVFDVKHKINFPDFLDRFGILFQEDTSLQGNRKYKVEEADVPSELVKSYFVKEEYYFDPIRSTIDTRIIALCPVLHDVGESEDPLKYPLFWVDYAAIRPHLSTLPIMLSDLNNATTSTVESFFRLHLYQGDIYKTQNRLGRALAQYCPTPDSLYNERRRIERELRSFEEHLWIQTAQENNLDKAKATTSKKKGEGKTARARRQKTTSPQPASTPSGSSEKKPKRTVRGRF